MLLACSVSTVGHGGVAQLGERLLCKQEVIGSIPFTSTTASIHGATRNNSNCPTRVQASAPQWTFHRVLMRDSSGNRRLIFKNTEETRRSLPGVAAGSMRGLHREGWHVMAMGIWVMDCVFARPEQRSREEAQAYEK